MSDCLHSRRLRHTKLPCPSQISRLYSNSCPLSWWCYSRISSSVDPFSSCLQSFSASGSFPMSQFFPFSFSISPSNEYSGLISFRINWLDLLAVQGTLKSLLQSHSSKASILQHSVHIIVQEALVSHNKSFSMFVPNSLHSTQLKTIPLPVVLLLVY